MSKTKTWVALLLLVACGETSEEMPSPDAAVASPIVSPGTKECSELGPEGGRVSLGQLRIDVPAGALRSVVEFCVEARARSSVLLEAGAVALHFSSGVELAQPLEVTLGPGGDGFSALQEQAGRLVALSPGFSERSFSVPSSQPLLLGRTCPDCQRASGALDLLVVLDDSGSTLGLIDAFRDAMPSFLEALWRGDLDGDGVQDAPAVSSLRLGVTTVSMSVAHDVPTCSGDALEGRLQNDGCGGALVFDYSGDIEAQREELRCRLFVGVDGCGFEQPLEAMLRAVTPAASELRFFDGAPVAMALGHGDGHNEGFLRVGARLGVVVVVDEDDCSASDPHLYDAGATEFDSPLGLRCVSHPDALFSLPRYRDGLLALKSRPEDVVFGAVVGLPLDLEERTSAEILADPRMDPTSGASGEALLPVCTMGPAGSAVHPAPRLVAFAGEMEAAGAHGAIASACRANLQPALGRIAAALGASLRGE